MGPLVREEKLLEKEKGKYPIKKLRESVYVYDSVKFDPNLRSPSSGNQLFFLTLIYSPIK